MKPKITKQTFSSFSIIVVFLALMIIGTAFIPLLDVRFKLSHNLPQLSVRFSWPNASPEVIEEETSKIEGVLGKINQVISIEFTTGNGFGRVTLSFDKRANLNRKRYEVSMLIRQLRGNLPENMSYPEIVTNNIEDDGQTTFMMLIAPSQIKTRTYNLMLFITNHAFLPKTKLSKSPIIFCALGQFLSIFK